MWINIILLMVASIVQILPADDKQKLKFIGFSRKIVFFTLIAISVVLGVLKEGITSKDQQVQDEREKEYTLKIDSLNNVISSIKQGQHIQFNIDSARFNSSISHFEFLNKSLEETANEMQKIISAQQTHLNKLDSLKEFETYWNYPLVSSRFVVGIYLPFRKYRSDNKIYVPEEYYNIDYHKMDSVLSAISSIKLKDIYKLYPDISFYHYNDFECDSCCFVSVMPHVDDNDEEFERFRFGITESGIIIHESFGKPFFLGSDDNSYLKMSFNDMINKYLVISLDFRDYNNEIFERPQMSKIFWSLGNDSKMQLECFLDGKKGSYNYSDEYYILLTEDKLEESQSLGYNNFNPFP